MRFQKEIKTGLILCMFFTELSFTFVSGQSKITLIKEDTHKLPNNTVDIVDFNNVVIKDKNQIQIVNISDSNNYKILYSFDLLEGKGYHSIQHGRYVILEDRTTKHYSESVYDIYTDQLVDLQELDGSVGATRVAKKDKTILYNANYGKTIYDKQFGKIPEIKRQAKLKTFNRETKFIADSIMGSLWSPNEEWFFALKFLGKKGRIIKWERVLMNRDGKAIILPSEESTISQAAWSADGNYLAVPQINGKLTVFEIEWMDSIPQVKSSIRKSSFSSPIIFPPDGKYILYVKYYEDGHNIFGNDIMLTDNKLNFLEPLIKHNELIEIPVMWTNDQGLITQDGVTVKNSRIIYKYRIKYK